MSESPPNVLPSMPPPAAHREVVFQHSGRTERTVIAAATGAACASLDAAAAAWLSTVERERVARAVAKRRREFMLGRYTAKTALAVWHGRESFASFTIIPGAFDQPVVQGNSDADVTLAHTADAAVALAHERGHPMGVDLEAIDSNRLDVLRTQVAAAELPAATAALAGEAERLFVLWSAKEALSKALRCGLTCPFELLAATDARVGEAGVCSGTFKNFGQYQFVAWVVGSRTFALVCSRNAELAPALPAMVRFTRESLGGPS